MGMDTCLKKMFSSFCCLSDVCGDNVVDALTTELQHLFGENSCRWDSNPWHPTCISYTFTHHVHTKWQSAKSKFQSGLTFTVYFILNLVYEIYSPGIWQLSHASCSFLFTISKSVAFKSIQQMFNPEFNQTCHAAVNDCSTHGTRNSPYKIMWPTPCPPQHPKPTEPFIWNFGTLLQ